MTTEAKIAALPLHDLVALEQAARINRSIVVAKMVRAAFRWVAGLFSGHQDALRFRGGARA
jgi:hypothetical protein